MKNNRHAAASDSLPRTNRDSLGRLLCGYTLLFAIFLIALLSPFWLYGKTFLSNMDGVGLYMPSLLYSRFWGKTVLTNLTQGRFEIPFWSPWIGFGQETIGSIVAYRPFNFLYALFPTEALEAYLTAIIAIGFYFSGLSFLAFARTRVRDHTGLLLGCMLYLFSGFMPIYITSQWVFLGLMTCLPLMLLGVDQIFKGKWSWLFIFVVFKKATISYYQLYMVTLPAVIYALFHYFELKAEDRARCGGFIRIVLRHAVHFLAGIGLAGFALVPALFSAFASSRFGMQQGVSLLHWMPRVYLEYLRAFVDVESIAHSGRIALPSMGLIAIIYLFYAPRKRDRLLRGQIIFYNLCFLIPCLTMVFSAFAGRSMRWCYAFSFWVAVTAACMLPRIRRDRDDGYRFCKRAFCVYAVIYLIISIWTGKPVTLGFALVFLGFSAFYATMLSDWGRHHKKLASVLLLAMLLVELTAKSYEQFSPQYENLISRYLDAGTALDAISDNAADALEMTEDDGLFRTDVIANSTKEHNLLFNYGTRSRINGLSSYLPLMDEHIISYSLDLGNAHQRQTFKISDFDQRTTLNELAAVKYAAVLEEDLARVPYGYALIGSRDKERLDGSMTTEYLYENQYALPLSYAYTARISREDYDALSPSQKEQSMLQGVVLEADAPLKPAELRFDEEVLLDNDAVIAALQEAARDSEYLEVTQGKLRVKKANFSVSIPIEQSEGEIYLQFGNISYRSVDVNAEKAEKLRQEGAPRLTVMNSMRLSRQWEPDENTTITVSTGDMSNYGILLDEDSLYYFGGRDFLLNLGYGKTGKKLKLNFSHAGEYSFDSVQLVRQPMDAYAEKIAPLQARKASSVEIDGYRVTLEYDLNEDALACLAIPYSPSWSATVDGEKAEILPANGMYMGIMLKAGRHTVVFQYMLRGFRLGVGISLATLLVLVIAAIFAQMRRKAVKVSRGRKSVGKSIGFIAARADRTPAESRD